MCCFNITSQMSCRIIGRHGLMGKMLARHKDMGLLSCVSAIHVQYLKRTVGTCTVPCAVPKLTLSYRTRMSTARMNAQSYHPPLSLISTYHCQPYFVPWRNSQAVRIFFATDAAAASVRFKLTSWKICHLWIRSYQNY